MYRYADPIAGRHEAHLRKATRSGVKSARAKEQVNEIAEATQQSTKSGRLHLSYNENNLARSKVSPVILNTKHYHTLPHTTKLSNIFDLKCNVLVF